MRPTLLRILYAAQLGSLADALSVPGREKTPDDHLVEVFEGLEVWKLREQEAGRLVDAEAAEATIIELLAECAPSDLYAAGLRGADEVRDRLMVGRGVRARASIGSEDGMAYFDELARRLSSIIVQSIRQGHWSAQVMAAGLSELTAGHAEILELLKQARPARPPELGQGTDPTQALGLAARLRPELDPEILPPVRRLDTLAEHVSALPELPFPLVILGDGGLGKSVLAGQLFDHFASVSPTLLVECTKVPSSAETDSASRLDRALGTVASGLDAPLSTIVASISQEPVVIVDTIDLLLDENTADDVRSLLVDVARSSRLVVSCREREWRDLVAEQWPAQGATWVVPPLGADEILEWSRLYVHAANLDHRQGAMFLGSLRNALTRRRSVDVLGVPLRLAMACDLYAREGALPEDLSVVKLYQEYWRARVALDRRGRRTMASATKEDVALSLGGRIWSASVARFVEDVQRPPPQDETPLQSLESEGIVKPVGARVAFFHQTFAEFAVARYLAARGDDADFARLGAGLGMGRSGYWNVGSYLLSEELSNDRLVEIATHLPTDRLEGLRLALRAGFAQPHGTAAIGSDLVFDLIKRDPDRLAGCSDILGEAHPNSADDAARALILLARARPAEMSRIAHALATLAAALPAGESARLTEEAISVLGQYANDRRDKGVSDMQVFAETLLTASSPSRSEATEMLFINEYDALPDAVRGLVARRLASRPADGASVTRLLDAALKLPCPAGSIADFTTLILTEWGDPASRARRGWHTWRQLLGQALPERWDACQVRAVLDLAGDRHLGEEVIEEALDPREPDLPRDRLVNTAEFLADVHPDIIIAKVANGDVGHNRTAAGAVATLTRRTHHAMTPAERAATASTLYKIRAYDPRHEWPAIIKLNADDDDALAAALTALLQDLTPETAASYGPAISSAIDALLQELTAERLEVHACEIDRVLDQCGSVRPAKRARLLAARAPCSQRARDAVFQLIVKGAKKGPAVEAASELVERREQWAAEKWDTVGLGWTVSLLQTPRAGALTSLTKVLTRDAQRAAWSAEYTNAVRSRLHRSLRAAEDPQSSLGLLNLLAVAARGSSISGRPSLEDLIDIVGSYEDALKRSLGRNASALWNHYFHAVSAIAPQVTDRRGYLSLVVRVLRFADIQCISGRTLRNLTNILVKTLGGNPDAWRVLEAEWSSLGSSGKTALIDAALKSRAIEGRQKAVELAQRVDCPAEAAARALRSAG